MFEKNTLDKFLNNLLKEYQYSNPWTSIGIIINKELAYTKSCWLSNIKTKEECSSKTNFRLASVSKQFTATCILQLVDQWKISLNDKLIKYFPIFKYGKDITIFNLLTHTSGLIDYEDIMDKTEKTPISDKKVLELLAKEKSRKFNAWENYSYNNWEYCILKEIIEYITNLTFAEYLKKNIFIPLEMNNTLLSERNTSNIKNKAIWYSINRKKEIIETDNDKTSFTMWDWSIYSNIEDLSKWVTNRKKILSPKMLQLQEQGHFKTNKKNTLYWFWLNITKLDNNKVVYHGWYSIWFRTSIYNLPENKISIIFLSNLHKNYGSDIAQKIAEFLLEHEQNANQQK